MRLQINQVLELLETVLQDDLLGVYLYGSSVLGEMEKFSDIDFLVVSQTKTSVLQKTRLVEKLLKISGIYGKSQSIRPIELTLVVQSEINPWSYPPSFDFKYGEWLRSKFENGILEPWKTNLLPDLAIAITQVQLAGQTLYGAPPNQIFEEVPDIDVFRAVYEQIDQLLGDLETDTRNVLLTLARIWFTLETANITSKAKAAAWVLDQFDNEEFTRVIQRAQDISSGKKEDHWEDLKPMIEPTAEFMLENIKLLQRKKINTKTGDKIQVAI